MPHVIKKYQFFLLFVLSICAFFLCFYNLSKAPLENWDEVWYAQMTREMLRTKDIFVLHWDKAVLLDKPPFFIWITTLFALVFGLSEFSMRLPSALGGFFLILWVVWVSYKKWGIIPSLAAFSSLSFNNIFMWRVRTGNIDIVLTLLIVACFFMMQTRYKNRFIVLGILFGCIYLTKISIVFFPVSIFILYEVIYRREDLVKNIVEYGKLFGIFLGIASVWLYVGYMRVGKSFVDYYLFYSDQAAAKVELSQFNFAYIQHMYYSLQRRYLFFFLAGLFFLFKEIKKAESFLIICFSVFLVVFLSFSLKNNNWYLVPSMPFWSLSIAFGFYKLLQVFKNSPLVKLIFILLIVYMSYKTFTGNILPLMNTYSTTHQVESAKKLQTLTKESEVIVRLDHLYPATVYYADRKILLSPRDANTKNNWLSRIDLITKIKKKETRWLVGTTEEVNSFKQSMPDIQFKHIQVNESEVILKVE